MEERIQIRDTRNGDWFWANKLVLDHPYFKASTKLVYLALASFANNENQKAYPSIKTIMEKTGLGSRTTIVNSIKQLEEYHFIEAKRKAGKVSEYILLKITDSKPVQKMNQSKKRRHQSIKDTGVVHLKHTNKTNITIHNNKNKDKSLTGKEVNDLIDLFKEVNPSWERLFAMKTQRKSIENLVKKHGKEKVEKMIKFLPKVVSKPYAPRITTPYILENKLGELLIFIKQEQNKTKKSGVAIL